MACSVEMLPCDACGREVIYFYIRVVTTADGERAFVCAECAGEEETSETSTPTITCD
jgi:hypothetical protein